MLKEKCLKVINNPEIIKESTKYDEDLKSVSHTDESIIISYLLLNRNIAVLLNYNKGEDRINAIFNSLIPPFNARGYYTLEDVWGCDNEEKSTELYVTFSHIIDRLAKLVDNATFVDNVFDDVKKDF